MPEHRTFRDLSLGAEAERVGSPRPQKDWLQPCASTSDFDVGCVLGTGTYGLVNFAIHKRTKTAVAIKSISKTKTLAGHQVRARPASQRRPGPLQGEIGVDETFASR